MHIGFLTPEYPLPNSTRSGGLGTSIKNLAQSLVKAGTSVTVFLYGQDFEKSFMEDGISFHIIKQRKYRVFGWYFYRKYLQNYLNKYIQNSNIDLIEAPDWTGITAFMKFHCPLIIRLNGSDGYFCHLEKRKQKRKNYFFEKRALSSADRLVSVSEFTAKITSEIFSLEKSIPVVPNSLDVDKFLPGEEQVIKNRLLYFGSLIRKKGVLELSEIFNRIIKEKPQVELFLLGKDVIDIFEKKSTLKLFLDKLDPAAVNKVTHIPEVKYKEVRSYIASSEIILLPSFAEALPMTWLEAMAMEKPIVSSNIGWAKEVVVDDETGCIEDPKNHNAFAAKVLKLLRNPEKARKMGMAARKHVIKNFSTAVVSKKNLDLYKRVKKGEMAIFQKKENN